MNLVGKIFVVLIFVMSVVFMSFAVVIYATHTNWRARATALEEKLKTVEKDLTDATNTRQRLEVELGEELARRADSIGKLKGEIGDLNGQIIRQQEELDASKVKVTNQLDALAKDVEQLDVFQKEVDGLRERLLKSQTEWATLHANYIRKTDEAHSRAIQLAKFRSVGAQLAKDYGDAVAVLKIHDLKPDPALYAGPPKGIRGTVTEVRPNGWVEISIGEDSGILVGHKLDIVRNVGGRSSYIARIKVERTEPDRAAAIIIPETRRGNIQREDRVEYIDTYEFSAN